MVLSGLDCGGACPAIPGLAVTANARVAVQPNIMVQMHARKLPSVRRVTVYLLLWSVF